LRRLVRSALRSPSGAADLIGLDGHHRVRKIAIISRSRSGDAEARCCSINCAGSTLCGAAIVVILS
jgi:hypothetical protein